MKKTLLYLALLAVIATGCKKLNETVDSSISSNQFYTSAGDLSEALTAVYKQFQQAYGYDYTYYVRIETASETGGPGGTKENPHLYNNWSFPNNADNSIPVWSDSYKVINQANAVIVNSAKVNMDATAKTTFVAEARFLRGLTYFYLLRLFGGVAIPETNTTSLANLNVARKTADETYDYLIADLQFAAANLPKKSAIVAANRWRADQGAANALLGKVLLYRASMTTDAAKKTTYYTDSKTYSALVISSGQYSLEANFKDLWYYYNTNNKHGAESIFELEFGYKSIVTTPYPNNSNQLHMFTGLNILDPLLGCQMFTRYGPSFYAYDSFSATDARFAATFATTYTLSTGKTITWNESNLGKVNITPGNWPVSYPGNVKMWDRSAAAYSAQASASDIYIIRYAEVLLNYAEAENALNGGSGDALQKINQVRTRAALPALAGLSQTQLADAIYQERAWEFIGEGQVYYDALRTDKLADLVQAEVSQGVTKGYLNYLPLQFKPAKTFLWKIPTYDLNSNPALVQNPDNVSK